MKIAVLGTGTVGRSVAARLAELGHYVTMGTRDPESTSGRGEPDPDGNPPYSAWAGEHPSVALVTFADAAAGGEVIVNATPGAVSLDVLHAAGAANLSGKILIDIANPLDFSNGMPPTLFVKDTDSLGERIQREFPDAKVVKTLNVGVADLMGEPRQLADGAFSTFISGNDPQAKESVAVLLRAFGHTDIIDLGDISAARATEMMFPIWLRLWRTLDTPIFAFKIVR